MLPFAAYNTEQAFTAAIGLGGGKAKKGPGRGAPNAYWIRPPDTKRAE